MTRFLRYSLAILPPLMLLSSCASDNTSYYTSRGATWGTTYTITYRHDRDMSDSIRAVMRQVELSLSPFEPQSIISAINRGEDPVVDSLITTVFAQSLEVNRMSRGAFDPTLGPLIRLWGFGEDKSIATYPSQERIDSALSTVGIQECAIVDGHIVKKHPSTQFNFSAITKGFGCDMVGEMLRRNGVTDYMVEIGGEIAVAGHNPKGADWRIMVDAPTESNEEVIHQRMAVISVTDCGVATSGNYRNYRGTGAKKIGHTINSRTGKPVTTTTLSATVVAPNTMIADALATACMAMPVDSAIAMLESYPPAAALIVDLLPDSTLRMRTTSGFPPIER